MWCSHMFFTSGNPFTEEYPPSPILTGVLSLRWTGCPLPQGFDPIYIFDSASAPKHMALGRLWGNDTASQTYAPSERKCFERKLE